MPSHFSGIDFSEEDRQKMMDVVRLFSEREARDELGIGTVRDSFAEFFFPGTSTIKPGRSTSCLSLGSTGPLKRSEYPRLGSRLLLADPRPDLSTRSWLQVTLKA